MLHSGSVVQKQNKHFINVNFMDLLSVLLLRQRHLCGGNVHLLRTRRELPAGPCYQGNEVVTVTCRLHSFS